MLFGAQLHFTGTEESHWGELEIAREAVTEQLVTEGLNPYAIPIGGSTAVGALGYAAAFIELLDQCEAAGVAPSHVVFTSSSGGTHAGLLAGRAAAAHAGRDVPDIVAVGVAKGVNIGRPDVTNLANQTLTLMQSTAIVAAEDVEVDTRWMGEDYAVPTETGDAAIRWAASHGGWLLDRTYSGKGCAGLLGLDEDGRFGSDVVFIHTGGWPALFAPDGVPA
jgi:1-aminocyclopropane-1-carboxylate deaminase/D-cysteine desulfhydrase-like pyridoxal-dependent ACC family enzyme